MDGINSHAGPRHGTQRAHGQPGQTDVPKGDIATNRRYVCIIAIDCMAAANLNLLARYDFSWAFLGFPRCSWAILDVLGAAALLGRSVQSWAFCRCPGLSYAFLASGFGIVRYHMDINGNPYATRLT